MKDLESLLSVIERNRQENLKNSREEFSGLYSDNFSENEEDDSESAPDCSVEPGDVKLVIFAEQSPFLTSLTNMLSAMTVAALFDNPEKAINFSLEYKVKNVLVDLDKPTNCYQSINVFSALRTISPETKVFVCTNRPLSNNAGGLKHKGGVILPKPMFRKQTEDLVKHLQ
ncbi:hypothetical protein QA601_13585 [Chitinispirillales bacterium ANBcel5]|uniref:hypothetical protein n=1 Tax=Cellulosispirillum alkaliphilum TaxID=3039283 RepID=UPI002A5424D1|nr:hypothetical protein [Chitinispirillales bacterium ANBcel5]